MLRVAVPYMSRSCATKLHTILVPLQRPGLDSGILRTPGLLFSAEGNGRRYRGGSRLRLRPARPGGAVRFDRRDDPGSRR